MKLKGCHFLCRTSSSKDTLWLFSIAMEAMAHLLMKMMT
jgi:hypothetical protein